MDAQAQKLLYWSQVPSAARLEALIGQVLELEPVATLSKLDPDADIGNSFARDRVFSALRLLHALLAQSDPLLVSEPGLANLGNGVQAILAELTHLINNGNYGHLANARNHLDSSIFPHLWAFSPIGEQRPLVAAFVDSVREIEASSRSAIENLSAERESQQARFQSIEAALKARIDTAESAAEELAAAIATQTANNAAAVAQIRLEYAQSEAERVAKFGSVIEQLKIDAKMMLTDATRVSDSMLVALRDSDAEAKKLVEAIGTKGITANYELTAEEEGKTANNWRRLTIAIFAVGMGVAATIFYKFLTLDPGAINIGETLLRLGFAIAITSPAFYAARESARHRTIADRARQSGMELASLGPFIANLERDTQDSIRRDLVSKYFGRVVEAHVAEFPVKFADVKDLAVEVVKAVGDKKK